MEEDDVLSIEGESWRSELSEASYGLDQEFVLVDEVGEEDDHDQKIEEDHGIVSSMATQDVEEPSSSNALRPFQEGRSATPKSRLRTCQVCKIETREKIRRHVLKEHVPWFWYAATACWECEKQVTQKSSVAIGHTHTRIAGQGRKISYTFDEDALNHWCLLVNGSLHLFVKWFGCGTLNGLLEYAISRELHKPVMSGFSKEEEQILMFYIENYSPDRVLHVTVHPPNHVICLVNWELTVSLLRRVSSEKQQEFVKNFRYLTYEGDALEGPVNSPSEPFYIVDTHFHLDLVLKTLRYRNFQDMSLKLSSKECWFYFGIANYVFPANWPHWKEHLCNAIGVYLSFGVHPHIASKGVSEDCLRDLQTFLREPRCVAVGEIGLDYTIVCECEPCRIPHHCKTMIRQFQEEAFVQQLLIGKRMNLPVIIHCHDHGDGAAAAHTLELINQHGCQDMKFHRHCFTGGMDELLQWQALPNVVFGVTWKSVKENPTVVQRVATSQLILESDAPYLSPYSCGPTNHPWHLPAVAVEVARLRNVPLSILNYTTNENAGRFYAILKASEYSV